MGFCQMGLPVTILGSTPADLNNCILRFCPSLLPMETPEYLRYLAERCRNLAHEIDNPYAPIVRDLLRMADKFEDRAARQTAQRADPHKISVRHSLYYNT